MHIAGAWQVLLILGALALANAYACPFGSRPCAAGCTPPLGSCFDRTCFDRKGKQVECEPPYELCNGVACALEEFCAGSVCQPNTCKQRRLYACPADTSPLRSVECSGPQYTDCYRSDSFNCSMGAAAVEITCTLQSSSAAAKPQIHLVLGLLLPLLAAALLAVAA